MSRIISRFEVNYTAKNDAFPYQRQSVETIKDMDYSAIFHEQGLGKTKLLIYFYIGLHREILTP